MTQPHDRVNGQRATTSRTVGRKCWSSTTTWRCATSCESFLTERGYQAVTLGSAEEAVKRYHAERPAAVILDVVMPGAMDGLEALAAFKKIDREVPIIVLSGQGRTHDRRPGDEARRVRLRQQAVRRAPISRSRWPTRSSSGS